MSRFEGKVAIVTGGGTGIGKATAEAILAEGGKVVGSGRRRGPLEALRDAHSENVRIIEADVAKNGDAKRTVDFAIEEFGAIDVLVNNAGVLIMVPLSENTDEDIDLLFSINVKGVLVMAREALPHLAKTQGAIVNISSIVADSPMAGAAPYSGTKAAVQQITRALAVEFGPMNVRVNAVAPGVTETDMVADFLKDPATSEYLLSQTPLDRFGLASDIAKSVVFLASSDASWVTGQVLQSSGGMGL